MFYSTRSLLTIMDWDSVVEYVDNAISGTCDMLATADLDSQADLKAVMVLHQLVLMGTDELFRRKALLRGVNKQG